MKAIAQAGRAKKLGAVTATMLTAALALSACSGGGESDPASGAESGESAPAPAAEGISSGDEAYDAIVNAGPIADEETIASSEWATKVKESGVLKIGGTETAELFSHLDPTTGVVTGFDAGLSQLLARYIFGDASKTELTQVTSETREEVLINGQVDVVFATYSITPERLERISFAGPYYSSAAGILVKKDNTDIKGIEDLAGKKVATQAGSTGIATLEEFAPEAEIVALPDHAQAVQSVQQGRVDAYVIDRTLLQTAVVQNDDLAVVGEPFGTEDPYGIGLALDSDGVEFINEWLTKVIDDGSWLDLWKLTIGERTGDTTEPTPPTVGSTTK